MQRVQANRIEKVTLQRQGNSYVLNNPSHYYLTVVERHTSVKGNVVRFEPEMVSPENSVRLGVPADEFVIALC